MPVRRTVLYASPHVPAGWIRAHGLEPVRLAPGSPPGAGPIIEMQAGVCPYMAAFINQAAADPAAAGVIVASTCDQLRRGADALAAAAARPVFLLNVPATCRGPTPRRLYAAELRRLGRFLESLGGRSPKRGRWTWEAPPEASPPADPGTDDGVPVMVLGGPLTFGQRRLFAFLREQGARVAVDGTEEGTRTRPPASEPGRAASTAFDRMVDAYLAIPDIFRRPNTDFYQWLDRERTRVRGIVVVRQVWCDLWHAEVARIRDAAGVPVVDVEMQDDDLPSRAKVRLQAFLEQLR